MTRNYFSQFFCFIGKLCLEIFFYIIVLVFLSKYSYTNKDDGRLSLLNKKILTHTSTQTQTHWHTEIHTNGHPLTQTHIQTHKHSVTNTYPRTHTQTNTHPRTQTQTHSHTHTHTHWHTYTDANSETDVKCFSKKKAISMRKLNMSFEMR